MEDNIYNRGGERNNLQKARISASYGLGSDDVFEKSDQSNDLEKGGKGSGKYAHQQKAGFHEKFNSLVKKRVKSPEDIDHHDDLHNHIKEHFGKDTAVAFSESFNPSEHSTAEAHEIMDQVSGKD